MTEEPDYAKLAEEYAQLLNAEKEARAMPTAKMLWAHSSIAKGNWISAHEAAVLGALRIAAKAKETEIAMSDEERVERIAKLLWAQKLKPGGGGRTLMAWPACPEARELRENAREIIVAVAKEMEAAVAAEREACAAIAEENKLYWASKCDLMGGDPSRDIYRAKSAAAFQIEMDIRARKEG